jgi:septal ring factor EnvC (AmiA/AmiB activator)
MLKLCLSAALCALFMVPAAQAKDLSALQTAAEVSRQDMSSAQAKYNADVQQVEVSKKNLAAARKRLKDAQAKAEQSRKRYQEAQARYRKAQTALDNAWRQ